MKKILIAMIIASGLHATDYYGILTELQGQIDGFNNNFRSYNAYVLDTSAAMAAISNVDFNPDHQGWSVGVGYAGIDSAYGRGNGYAVGGQYVYEQLAINVKGAQNAGGDYILGTGIVWGF